MMPELYRDKYMISPTSMMLVYLISQIKRKFSPIVLICGKQRIGKSSYGLTLADILTWFMHDEYLDIKKYVFFDSNEFLKQGVSVNGRVIIIDEASKDMSKSDWYTQFNKVMTKIIETQADLNNIYIIILPHASRLATQHKIYIDMKLVMKRRGEAKVFFMKKNYGELSSEIKRVIKARFLNIERLPKPDSKLWEEYEGYSTHSKRRLAQEELATLRKKEKPWVCLACGTKNKSSDYRCKLCDKGR